MKLVLSRKGFDSSAGGVPSPILPSGRLYSLPIPEVAPGANSRTYGELMLPGTSLGILVRDLTRGRILPDEYAHLDPDLDAGIVPRQPRWRPLFGQAGAAESHLQREGVGPGDIFLFYGWFRQVERVGDEFRYVRGTSHIHVIFGWLQVGQRVPLATAGSLGHVPTWALDHPHCKENPYSRLDSLYLSTPRLKVPGYHVDKPGGGTFAHLDPRLVLTAAGRSRRVWHLPAWFHPLGRQSALTYHGDHRRWIRDGEGVLLTTVGRGQEFVLDCNDYPEAIDWLATLFALV